MTCKDCEERRKSARDALLRSAVGESITHLAKGAAELVGVKKKTATADRNKADAKRITGIAGKQAIPATTAKEKTNGE